MTTREAPVLDRQIIRTQLGPEIGRNAFNQPIFGPDVTEVIWAARRDYAGRDFLRSSGPGGIVTLDDRAYTIPAIVLAGRGDHRHLHRRRRQPSDRAECRGGRRPGSLLRAISAGLNSLSSTPSMAQTGGSHLGKG